MKPRKLTVDGTDYLWRTYRPNGDGDGGIGLRVWEGQTVIMDEWLSGTDKPASVTPGYVSLKIQRRTRLLDVLERGPVYIQ